MLARASSSLGDYYRTAEDYYRITGLTCAFGAHFMVLAIGFNNIGVTYFTAVPLTMVELAFVVLATVRLFFLSRRSDLKKQDGDFVRWLFYPNQTGNEVFFLLGSFLLLYRALLFNEFNDCLLEDCYTTREQNIVALVGSAIAKAVITRDKKERLPELADVKVAQVKQLPPQTLRRRLTFREKPIKLRLV